MSPEAKAIIEIVKKLTTSGYVFQDMKSFNPTASMCVTVSEIPT